MLDFLRPDFFQQLVDGLGRGSSYALIALGLAIVFGVMHLLNFAHGELITVSAYVAYFLLQAGIDWAWVTLAIIVTSVLCAVTTDAVAFRRVRKSSDFTTLLTSFGLVILVRAAFSHWVEIRPRNLLTPSWAFNTVELMGLRLEVYDLLVIVVTAITLVALTYVLQRTLFGVILRAAAEDFDAARLMGVSSNRVIRNAFMLSGFLAGIGGALLLIRRGQADPGMGLEVLMMPLLATIIGGLGSLRGAVLGGLLLGVLEVFLRSRILPNEYSHFTDAVLFTLIALLFIVRPQGLVTVQRAERI